MRSIRRDVDVDVSARRFSIGLFFACALVASCSRTRRAAPYGATPTPVFTAVPPLPPGDPKLPRWENECLGEPRSPYHDWIDVLVITPDNLCFKDKRRHSRRIVFDAECESAGPSMCGTAIQCPAAGTPLGPGC